MLDKFIYFLQVEKRYSMHTLEAYQNDLNQFYSYIQQHKLSFEEVNKRNIRNWMIQLLDEGQTTKTIHRKISSLRAFYKWMLQSGSITLNPLLGVSVPKLQKRIPEFVKEQEMHHLDVQIFPETLDGIRDHLIIELFYQTGVRLSELINLKTNDFNANQIKVLGKRNKERIIPISKELYMLYVKYLNLKQSANIVNEYVFVRNNGNKMYEKLVYRKINYYLGLVTKMDKRSPHVLRHTFATHLLNNGAGLEVLKEVLGHSSLSATQVYTHNSFKQLTNIYSQAHPRGHKN
jgi:integrase/recombinase XerC